MLQAEPVLCEKEVIMRKNKLTPLIRIGIFVLAPLAFASCGQSPADIEDILPVQTQAPAATSEPAAPKTEAELRQAISEMGEEDSLVLKQEYYERLLSMDVFGEGDYVELAQIYGESGNWEGQRRMLSKVLRLFPSQEYAEQLSAVIIRRDSSDPEMAVLAGQITEALKQEDALTIKNLVLSEEWRRLLQDNMDAIETRTLYQNGEEVLQIAARGTEAMILWLDGHGQVRFYRESGTGILLGSASLDDGVYAGDVKVIYSDAEGNVEKSIQGTLSDGVCVGQLTVFYQGTEYVGNFREDGSTAEEQLEEVTEQGGVLYAYGPGNKTYLYQENAELVDFRIGPAFLGLPEYEDWR